MIWSMYHGRLQTRIVLSPDIRKWHCIFIPAYFLHSVLTASFCSRALCNSCRITVFVDSVGVVSVPVNTVDIDQRVEISRKELKVALIHLFQELVTA